MTRAERSWWLIGCRGLRWNGGAFWFWHGWHRGPYFGFTVMRHKRGFCLGVQWPPYQRVEWDS